MQLYNTLSRRLEPFEAESPVGLYVCGITPYDTTHLGHAFLYVAFDVLIRHLESKGLTVEYTQNVTDVDDDVLKKANELGMDYLALAERETKLFTDDMTALNVRPPDHYPRATQEVERIAAMVESLVGSGAAYVREGNVYFDISAYPEYGELSRASRDEMLELAAERGGNPDDPLRDDPLDFLLWQAQQPGEPAWPSAFGPGRPGWHIECSEMSLRYLGGQVTIHGGGADLIFPHHESERAQSEVYTGAAPFVRYWMHVGMVGYQGEKMSKSLGNLVLVDDLLLTHSADAVRLALLTHHYRAGWEYNDEFIEDTQRTADRIARAVYATDAELPEQMETDAAQRFDAALDNDLDTPAAIEVLLELVERIESGAENDGDLGALRATLREKAAVLGLTLEPAQPPPAS